MTQSMNMLTVLNRDPICSSWLRPSRTVTVLRQPDIDVALRETHVFVFALASKLEQVAEFVRNANRNHHLRALLVNADLDERWISQMLDRADLRTLRNLLVHSGNELPRRILEAWKHDSQDVLIADALALPDRLILLTCSLERLEVPWSMVSPLARMRDEWRSEFQLANDGSYVYWPESDVHLDLEALRLAVDPKARQAAEVRRQKQGELFGRAVAVLRRSRGLNQTDVEGLSARQVRRIESGEMFPRVSTLTRLAETHGMSLDAYLEELAVLQGDRAYGRGTQ